jgi:hypothetical protein
VQRLENEMVKLKGKALGQPTQDNYDHMVNKLELGTTILDPPLNKNPSLLITRNRRR